MGEDAILLEKKKPCSYILKKIEKEAMLCTRCSLHRSRKKVVFGQGNPYAKLFFIGEAPGQDEDREGLPFVGRAGQKLNQVLKELKIPRKDVYIGNVLKCRPPRNRDPQQEEIQRCFPYLKAQIELIHPGVIVCLGRYAGWTLTGIQGSISEMRKKIYYNFGAKVFVTYHPSSILRMEHQRYPLLKEDIQKAIQYLRNLNA